MQAILVLALAACALALTDQEKWAQFKATYGKPYTGMGANEAYRFSVFQQNLRNAEQLQKENPEAVFGVTKFSDLTPEEFKAMYTGLNTSSIAAWHRSLPKFHPTAAHTRAVGSNDWRGKRVGSVKDQGQCGSCWAFSAAAAAEACTGEKGQLVDLSAQQIVDCCVAGGSNGCNGGWPDQCLSWAMGQNLATSESYPYVTKKEASCKTSGFTVGLKAGTCSYHGVTGGEPATAAALSNNPVSICLDATPLQSYNSGVISGATCNKKNVDHAVLLVADDGAGDSYVVKNSWGAGWGEQGFFRMAKNANCLSFTSYNSVAY